MDQGPDECLELVWAECEGKGGPGEGQDGGRGQTSTCSLSGLNAKAGEVQEKAKMEGKARRALGACLGTRVHAKARGWRDK